jgi:hypothetical protein
MRHGFNRLRRLLRLLMAAAGAGFVIPALAAAQLPGAPPSEAVDLPSGPAKAGFDIKRFSNAGNGWFETFYVKDTQPLQKTLEEGKVAVDTWVLVTQTATGRLALLNDQMAYHHLAQGSAGGKDWLATF